MPKPKIYLSGPIAGVDAGELMMRQEKTRFLLAPEFDVFDPCARIGMRGQQLVDADLREIEASVGVIAFLPTTYSCIGTSMEVFYASRILRRPVFAYGTRLIPDVISPWHEVHCSCFSSLENAVEALKAKWIQ